MISLLSQVMLKHVKVFFSPYMNLYPFYLPSVPSDMDILSREKFLDRYVSRLDGIEKDEDKETSITLLGWNRTSAVPSPNHHRRGTDKAVFNYKNSNIDAVTINFNRVSWNMEMSFISNDVTNIEFIENMLLTEIGSSIAVTANINIPDVEKKIPISLSSIIDYNDDEFSPVDLSSFGSMWVFRIGMRCESFILSFESEIYPKIVDIITTIKDINGNQIDKQIVRTNEYDESGDLSSYDIYFR